jgi:hypothetical protein
LGVYVDSVVPFQQRIQTEIKQGVVYVQTPDKKLPADGGSVLNCEEDFDKPTGQRRLGSIMKS